MPWCVSSRTTLRAFLLFPPVVVCATAVATEPTAGPVSLVLASEAFEAADSEFVAHKTTRRAHYDAALRPEGFDTVLWNERGELTECTRGNLALCLDGQWLTPAAACGLLPGVGRG